METSKVKILFYLIILNLNVYSQDTLFSAKDIFLSNRPIGGFTFSVSGGINFPFRKLRVQWGIGYNLSANAGYIFSKLTGCRLDISYSSFEPEMDSYIKEVSGGRFKITSIRGDYLIGNFQKNLNMIPYGFIGFGIYFKNIEDLNYFEPYIGPVMIEGKNESEFGIAFGYGTNFKISSNIFLFGEIQYNLGFGNEPVSAFLPVKAGIMLIP